MNRINLLLFYVTKRI